MFIHKKTNRERYANDVLYIHDEVSGSLEVLYDITVQTMPPIHEMITPPV